MADPRVYVDFHNADAEGRLRLNVRGTLRDLAQQKVELRDGLVLQLYSDDLDENGQLDELVVEGAVGYSNAENCWVAAIDWTAIRHVSEQVDPHSDKNGQRPQPELKVSSAVR